MSTMNVRVWPCASQTRKCCIHNFQTSSCGVACWQVCRPSSYLPHRLYEVTAAALLLPCLLCYLYVARHMLAPSNCVKLIGEKPTSWESCRRPPNTRPDITHRHTSQLPRFISHTRFDSSVHSRFTYHSQNCASLRVHTKSSPVAGKSDQLSTLTYNSILYVYMSWNVTRHSYCALDLHRTVQVSAFWEFVVKIEDCPSWHARPSCWALRRCVPVCDWKLCVCVCARARVCTSLGARFYLR